MRKFSKWTWLLIAGLIAAAWLFTRDLNPLVSSTEATEYMTYCIALAVLVALYWMAILPLWVTVALMFAVRSALDAWPFMEDCYAKNARKMYAWSLFLSLVGVFIYYRLTGTLVTSHEYITVGPRWSSVRLNIYLWVSHFIWACSIATGIYAEVRIRRIGRKIAQNPAV